MSSPKEKDYKSKSNNNFNLNEKNSQQPEGLNHYKHCLPSFLLDEYFKQNSDCENDSSDDKENDKKNNSFDKKNEDKNISKNLLEEEKTAENSNHQSNTKEELKNILPEIENNIINKKNQPKMSYFSGVKNIAPEANVKITNLNDGQQYINDGLFVSHEYYKAWETTVDKLTKITLSFDEPRDVSSVMVYNSYDYKYAFSAVDSIEFDLAESPSWTKREGNFNKAYIGKINFSEEYINQDGFMRQGASCLASFNSIKVKSITISISQKISNENNQIKISDVVVLGK